MQRRSNIAVALVLILVGVWFLAVQVFPGLKIFAFGSITWPMAVIGAGGLLALISLLTWVVMPFLSQKVFKKWLYK